MGEGSCRRETQVQLGLFARSLEERHHGWCDLLVPGSQRNRLRDGLFLARQSDGPTEAGRLQRGNDDVGAVAVASGLRHQLQQPRRRRVHAGNIS